jgi:NAD(P)-dependent dehydrogenase (short-subunit alcohol dehydrogenase family)
MARVFMTGSSDGLGQMAAQLLIEQGHKVVLHARTEKRGHEAISAVPGAEAVVIGDLTSIAQTRNVADQVIGPAPSTGSFTMPPSAIKSPGVLPVKTGCLTYSPSTRWRLTS